MIIITLNNLTKLDHQFNIHFAFFICLNESGPKKLILLPYCNGEPRVGPLNICCSCFFLPSGSNFRKLPSCLPRILFLQFCYQSRLPSFHGASKRCKRKTACVAGLGPNHGKIETVFHVALKTSTSLGTSCSNIFPS